MPNESYAKTMGRWSFRTKAVAANLEEVPHLEGSLSRLNELLARAYDLSAQQAALTAAKQEVSKQLREVIHEGRKVVAFLDSGLRLHYGNRSEKLVELGQQPFRSKPRVRLVGPDGQPLSEE